MKLRSYGHEEDFAVLRSWVEDERVHALWCAGQIPFPLNREEMQAFLERDAAEWGTRACMAEMDDGQPFGFFCYSVNPAGASAFLKFILLDPGQRGKGLGTELLQLVTRQMFDRKNGFDGRRILTVQLNVFDINEAALRCYCKAGFREDARQPEVFAHGAQRWGRCHMTARDPETENAQGEADIIRELYSLRDEKYAAFQRKLIPTLEKGRIIGVRTPQLRAMAKRLAGQPEGEKFLRDLPHYYFEENQLHAFLIGEEKNFDVCVKQTEAFLPCVDNWATCDQLSPKVFSGHRRELLACIRRWIGSDRVYTIRFGLGMLMRYFLDEDFQSSYLRLAAGVVSEEYYVNMMIAWYFATALARQYEAAIPFIEQGILPEWTHNKTIRKALESNRISSQKKEYLRTLQKKSGTGCKIKTE